MHRSYYRDKRMNLMTHPETLFSPEVKNALDLGRPLVALESTLISHGLPWPENIETALACEALVRDSGAVPATIALIDGKIRIGLELKDLETLGKNTDGRIQKAARRDLAVILRQSASAATTVSATMFLARLAGIRFMATGGLGGVHRHAAESFDISMDLDELARADGVALVCSGVKSILDIPATLEKMETLGISTIGYQTLEFPAFTELTSKITLDHHVDSAAEAAGICEEHHRLGIPGAIVFAQPCPAEPALDSDVAKSALEQSLREAHEKRIAGKTVTPFLLSRMRELTSGQSLIANKALIMKNAATAGQIAAAYESLISAKNQRTP